MSLSASTYDRERRTKAAPAAAFAWEELLLGSIRNPHTRIAYGRAVGRLLGCLETRSMPLAAVTPGIIGGYFDELQGSVPSKKLALAAIRRFFDALVNQMCCSRI